MEYYKRTKYCGEFSKNDIGKEVIVCGWVQRQRDLGQLIFIDLRDRSGIVQLAFDDNTNKNIFEEAFKIRSEYVIAAKGLVRERFSKNFENVPIIEEKKKYIPPMSHPFKAKSFKRYRANVKVYKKFKYKYRLQEVKTFLFFAVLLIVI